MTETKPENYRHFLFYFHTNPITSDNDTILDKLIDDNLDFIAQLVGKELNYVSHDFEKLNILPPNNVAEDGLYLSIVTTIFTESLPTLVTISYEQDIIAPAFVAINDLSELYDNENIKGSVSLQIDDFVYNNLVFNANEPNIVEFVTLANRSILHAVDEIDIEFYGEDPNDISARG